MTSSPRPLTSSRWPASSWIPLLVPMLLFLASGFVGLTDDESYYWVLAQKPALGYAFHPPMVAWMIFLAQKSLGFWFAPSSPFVVRFFSCTCMGVLFALVLDWIRRAGGTRPVLSALCLGSLAGVFGLGWMMVPDVPLFLGWILAFYAAWRIGFEESENFWLYVLLSVGVSFAILGKYSGVLVPASSVLSVLVGPYCRRRFVKTFAAATLGALVALTPILIWNSQHEWQSILYQFQERHQDSELSWKRYLRFWIIELVAACPILVIYSLALLKRAVSNQQENADRRSILRFVAIWMAPAALIFCVQPLWSDFKPHWAFIVWLPGAIALAWEAGTRELRWTRVQIAYGLSLIAIVWVGLQIPLLGTAIHSIRTADYDPRWDVTNDLYGWNRLAEFAQQHRRPDGSLPYFTASHYQTASQAAASLGSLSTISLLPRDLKARDEWPVLPVSQGIGPDWPALTQTIYYVGDNRYDAPPEYKGSHCKSLPSLESYRGGLLAKKILIWECVPDPTQKP